MNQENLKTMQEKLDELLEELVPKQKLTIKPWQHYKIRVELISGDVRDEFLGSGPEDFEATLNFAKKIARMHYGAKVVVHVRSVG